MTEKSSRESLSTEAAQPVSGSLEDIWQLPGRNTVVLASIWAQDRNRLLGSGTDMLWHVPADFAHFKTTTLGCPVIMGRASWEALGRALPGRLNIVVTRNEAYTAPGAVVVSSIYEAVATGLAWAVEHEVTHVWITGGAQIYAETMPIVDELIVSELDLAVDVPEGQPAVYAPIINEKQWQLCLPCSDSQWRPQSGDARWKVLHYLSVDRSLSTNT